MIEETGQVVEVGSDYLKVASMSKSACGNCAAEKGCGQGVLNQWVSKATILTVALEGRDRSQFKQNDQVIVGIPESTLVGSAFLLYLLPLLFLIAGVLLGNWFFDHDSGVALLAITGLFFGAWVTRQAIRSGVSKSTSAIRPVLLGKIEPASS